MDQLFHIFTRRKNIKKGHRTFRWWKELKKALEPLCLKVFQRTIHTSGVIRSFWARCYHKAPINLNIPFLTDILLGFYNRKVKFIVGSESLIAKLKLGWPWLWTLISNGWILKILSLSLKISSTGDSFLSSIISMEASFTGFMA